MKQLGLIGFPLEHSFSRKYFSNKFEKEKIEGYDYELYPLQNIADLPYLLKSIKSIIGLNVTIPYKQAVIPYLDELDESAEEIGAVNTIIRTKEGLLKGYNTDVYGFEVSLGNFLKTKRPKALVLGTGGAAKAICYALKQKNISYKLVSRSPNKGDLTYDKINKYVLKNHNLIINTTPLGTAPNTNTAPDIPYQYLTPRHYLYDLVYNPEKTLFLLEGEKQGSKIINGLEMLYLQAEKAWKIWTTYT